MKIKAKGGPNIKILDLLFPPVCGICGKINENSLCRKCENTLKRQEEFQIIKTGVENNFNEHIYFFKYDGIIRKMLLKYKFKEKSYLYKTIVNYIIKSKKIEDEIKKYDIIIPVPISKKRKKQRGYNQSYLIAKEIGKAYQKEIEKKCLYKNKNIIEQSKLNKEQRMENIRGVYSIKNAKKIENKSILLIDDIFTTGSTVNECCKTIRNNANIKEIGVLTIAKD